MLGLGVLGLGLGRYVDWLWVSGEFVVVRCADWLWASTYVPVYPPFYQVQMSAFSSYVGITQICLMKTVRRHMSRASA